MENKDSIDVVKKSSGKGDASEQVKKKKKRKYIGKGKGNSSNSERKNDCDNKHNSARTKAYDNDLSWYADNKHLVDDVASIPLRYPLGTNKGAGDATYSFRDVIHRIYSWPGILSLEFIPSYGKSVSQSSAINIALRNIYQNIRQKNSGAKNYEAADLGTYLILMDSIYSMIAEGKRAYGLTVYSDIYNWYMPQDLLASAGFNYSQLAGEKAQFRSKLNERIVKINNFAVPNEWNIMQRHYWLNSMTFADDEDASKAQLYITKQMNHYTWTDYAASKMGFYNSNNKAGGIYPTIATYFARLDALIDNVYLFDDASLMSGDILKAYEPSGLLALDYLPEDYVAPIVHNKEVLQQIRNTLLLSFDTTDANNYLEINQSLGNGGLYCNPRLNVDVTALGPILTDYPTDTVAILNELYGKAPLYLDDGYATPEGVMIASRNLSLGTIAWTSGNSALFTPNETASEIFCAGRMFVRRDAANGLSQFIDDLYTPNVNSNFYNIYFRSIIMEEVGSSLNEETPILLSLASKFSYFPQLVFVPYYNDNDKGEISWVDMCRFGEVRALGYLDAATLGNIHRIAILSLLGSKAFGSGTSQLKQ